jgi:hypothetical protein
MRDTVSWCIYDRQVWCQEKVCPCEKTNIGSDAEMNVHPRVKCESREHFTTGTVRMSPEQLFANGLGDLATDLLH